MDPAADLITLILTRGRKWQLIAVVMVGLSFASVLFIIEGTFSSRRDYESVKSFFFEELERQMDLGTIKSIDDVERVRLGVAEIRNLKQFESAKMETLLAEFWVLHGQLAFDSEGNDSRE